MTTSLVIFLSSIVAVFGLLIWYALRNKGDVRAEMGHGKTFFKLEAKEGRGLRKITQALPKENAPPPERVL